MFQIFKCFETENPEIMNKVRAIAGDVCEKQLGLSEEDERTLIHSVDIVFHVAALVKFNGSLKDAINMNVEGTQRILQLADSMPKLQVLL